MSIGAFNPFTGIVQEIYTYEDNTDSFDKPMMRYTSLRVIKSFRGSKFIPASAWYADREKHMFSGDIEVYKEIYKGESKADNDQTKCEHHPSDGSDEAQNAPSYVL